MLVSGHSPHGSLLTSRKDWRQELAALCPGMLLWLVLIVFGVWPWVRP